jgi:hypothetical protein
MSIPLNVLVEAVECMGILREFEVVTNGHPMNKEDYMRCLRAYSSFKAEVEQVAKTVKVEVAE